MNQQINAKSNWGGRVWDMGVETQAEMGDLIHLYPRPPPSPTRASDFKNFYQNTSVDSVSLSDRSN